MEKWCSLVLLFDMEVFYLIWVILEEWCYQKVGGLVFFLTSYDVIWTQNQFVSDPYFCLKLYGTGGVFLYCAKIGWDENQLGLSPVSFYS